MVEPYFRRPRTREEWRRRGEILEKQLNGLSIDQLLRGGRAGDPPQLDAGNHFHHHGYDPNQPRVPAGHSDGGQWTNKGGEAAQGARVAEAPRSLDEVISDAIDGVIPGARYAAAARRPPRGHIFINGRPVQMSPGQATKLASAEAQARDAIARVREHDPNWKPRPSAYATVDGLISARRADAEQARERFNELQYYGIVPGPYFREGIPARGPDRDFRTGERGQVNRLLRRDGCHTCGIHVPGTTSGNAILDHQPPTGYNALGKRQYLLPHCATCSARQGWWIMRNRGSR